MKTEPWLVVERKQTIKIYSGIRQFQCAKSCFPVSESVEQMDTKKKIKKINIYICIYFFFMRKMIENGIYSDFFFFFSQNHKRHKPPEWRENRVTRSGEENFHSIDSNKNVQNNNNKIFILNKQRRSQRTCGNRVRKYIL